jgi:lipopolysaccharide transport system permease protein
MSLSLLRRSGADRQLRIVITPPHRWALPNVGRLWEGREILVRFAARDITLRYRQTALGVIWVVLQPLLAAGVLTFVFSSVAKLPSGGVPPILYTFAGMLVFNLTSSVVTRGSLSLVANASLVSKVFFPRLLVPLSTAGSALLDFVVSLGFMAILLAIYGVLPGLAVVLVPVWLFLTLCLAAGVAFVTSALTVNYRDVQYVTPFLLQITLYASPVAYSLGKISPHYRIIYDLNPMTWLLGDMRWSVLHQPMPSPIILALSVAVPLAVLLGGSLVFQKMERGFADTI